MGLKLKSVTCADNVINTSGGCQRHQCHAGCTGCQVSGRTGQWIEKEVCHLCCIRKLFFPFITVWIPLSTLVSQWSAILSRFLVQQCPANCKHVDWWFNLVSFCLVILFNFSQDKNASSQNISKYISELFNCNVSA